MTNAPYVAARTPAGAARAGDGEIVDTMIHDGLWSTFTGQHMGESSDQVNADLGDLPRGAGRLGGASHQRGGPRLGVGTFADEVVAVGIDDDGRSPQAVTRDEGIRPEDHAATLAELPPAFGPGGTITAGNASQLADGAAALVVMRARARRGARAWSRWPRSGPRDVRRAVRLPPHGARDRAEGGARQGSAWAWTTSA